MISSKRFIIIFASIFLLGSIPLVLGQPTGASSAGLTGGFTMPMEDLWQLVIFVALGVYASHLRGNALILLPLSFVMLFVVGIGLKFDHDVYTVMPLFIIGAIMIFALSVSVAENRASLFGMILSASFGFHFGLYYFSLIPAIASPLYFMIGSILSLAMVFAAAVSLGLAFTRERDASGAQE